MQHTRLIIGITLLLLLAIFTVQNVSVVTISFLFWSFSISRALMIFLGEWASSLGGMGVYHAESNGRPHSL